MFNLKKNEIMKKLTLLLALCMGLGLSATATTNSDLTKAKTNESFQEFNHPSHHGPHYRSGDFYRRVPRGAVRININGRIFYKYRSTWFKPVRRGYVVVNRPRHYRTGYGRSTGRSYGSRGGACRR